MRFLDYDIVFQEVPDETTLALNISRCPHRCPGCHSPRLWLDQGEVLTERALDTLIARYPCITCVAFMGGDADLEALRLLADRVRTCHRLRTAWYTGFTWERLPSALRRSFDYIKVGPYIEALGGLKSRRTNQRFYRMDCATGSILADLTPRFQRENMHT
ncbi:MAG: anaerobic ribonucleoside-triphosphate reductase activating protein [Paludibacteraceae bacterium]